MEIRIDCLGDMCPLPIVKARREMKKLGAGDSILLVTDHSCVARSLTEKLSKVNYHVAEDEVMNGIWEITITKV
jgi:tRNA 2-thiouridine synthesizing protein A